MSIKRIVPVAIIALSIAIVAYWMAAKPKPKTRPQVEKSWPVTSKPVHFSALSPELELLGVAESPSASQLTSTVSAYVDKVWVHEGDHVLKGQLLVQLNKDDIELQIHQRDAEVMNINALIEQENNRYQSDLASLKEDKTLLKLAKEAINRQRKLAKSKLTSQELIDNARNTAARQSLSVTSRELAIKNHTARLQQLQAKLKQAKAQLATSELNLQRTYIRAPFEGYITAVPASPGNLARAGETLVKLYDATHLEVRAQLPQRHVAAVKVALKDGFKITAIIKPHADSLLSDKPSPIKLKLTRLGAMTREGTGGRDAFFTLETSTNPNQVSRLIPGETLPLQVTLNPLPHRFAIPISALYEDNYIYLIKKGRLESHKIKVTGHFLKVAHHSENRVYKTRLIIQPLASDPIPIKENDRILTTQLPAAIGGLKVTDRSTESPSPALAKPKEKD
jgi:multidrug efflux pump subunit AcrA (membrane-fusion protein)